MGQAASKLYDPVMSGPVIIDPIPMDDFHKMTPFKVTSIPTMWVEQSDGVEYLQFSLSQIRVRLTFDAVCGYVKTVLSQYQFQPHYTGENDSDVKEKCLPVSVLAGGTSRRSLAESQNFVLALYHEGSLRLQIGDYRYRLQAPQWNPVLTRNWTSDVLYEEGNILDCESITEVKDIHSTSDVRSALRYFAERKSHILAMVRRVDFPLNCHHEYHVMEPHRLYFEKLTKIENIGSDEAKRLLDHGCELEILFTRRWKNICLDNDFSHHGRWSYYLTYSRWVP